MFKTAPLCWGLLFFLVVATFSFGSWPLSLLQCGPVRVQCLTLCGHSSCWIILSPFVASRLSNCFCLRKTWRFHENINQTTDVPTAQLEDLRITGGFSKQCASARSISRKRVRNVNSVAPTQIYWINNSEIQTQQSVCQPALQRNPVSLSVTARGGGPKDINKRAFLSSLARTLNPHPHSMQVAVWGLTFTQSCFLISVLCLWKRKLHICKNFRVNKYCTLQILSYLSSAFWQ